MKKTMLYAFSIIVLMACTKEYTNNISTANNGTNEITILSFDTPEALLESINAGEDYSIVTKGTEEASFLSLFTSISQIDIEKDPILSYEINKKPFEGDVTLYKLLGYDEMVPNEHFARLLNIRGEFQVGDTIYKISPHGTYYFPYSKLKEFEERYVEFEGTTGECIGERSYCMAPSVYRYDTFADMKDEDKSLPPTKNVPGYNWNIAETHQGNANEVFENQIFYKELQFNVRMKTRVYNHDYVAYQERGAYVKTQNKTWIGWWADKTATGLALGWNNIIMTKPYNGIFGPIFPETIPHITGTSTESFDNHSVSVIEITGYTIPVSGYNTIISGNYGSLRSWLINNINIDIMGYDLVRLIGPETIQMICPGNFKIGQEIDEVKAVFSYMAMGPCYKFEAGQFFYVGQDNDLVGTMRVGTYF